MRRGSHDLSNLGVHCTHEEEQDIKFVLESINLGNLDNLDDESQSSWHLTCWQWSFWSICGWFKNPLFKTKHTCLIIMTTMIAPISVCYDSELRNARK